MQEDTLARDIIRLTQTRGETPTEMLKGPVAFGIAVGAFLARLDEQPDRVGGPIRAAFSAGLCRGAAGPQEVCDLLKELVALVGSNDA
jgi:hypothetical protein